MVFFLSGGGGVSSMAAMEKAVVSSRVGLKREDCKRTKHDSAFSDWKILVGASDWEDHLLGKQGEERYRIHNLPNCSSCPGVYELGISVSRPRSGRDFSKLDPDFIIPVYIGQADSVRTRLQRYGRDGAHLGNGYSNCELNNGRNCFVLKGPGLFTDTFKKGFSIVYRWAPMKNKREAEKTEAKLLDKFDYAWNKGSNGERRHNDVLQKLAQMSSSDFLSRVFKFGRSQPRLVSVRFGVEGHDSICGVALGHGSICTRPPTEGRKRCAEHKGMKVNGSNTMFICGVSLHDGSTCTREPVQGNKRCEEHRGRRIHGSVCRTVTEEKVQYVPGPVFEYRQKSRVSSGRSGVNKGYTTICGVNFADGTFCTREPVLGRKRCEEHKGMRVKEPKPKLLEAEIPSVFDGSVSRTCNDNKYNNAPARSVDKEFIPTCGATTLDGSSCSRKPGEGNKRCWQHKGMKADTSSGYYGSSSRSASYSTFIDEGFSSTCGATTLDGSSCSRKPAEGNKRCWQHKGMKADTSSGYYGSSSRSASYSTFIYEGFSSTCGALCRNGSYCRRAPAQGRRRCWQH
ncbi:unnamed protein product [Ilex paraguariensis]|uniref:Protein EFFECTOR OF TRANSCRIPTION 2-like n=1 Tax=Ilex paraguariensis TaxID=185542 RepID=A0ABC8RQK6_9AQUA